MDLGRTRASPLDGTTLSYKTNNGGVDDRDVSESLVRELELRRGSLGGPNNMMCRSFDITTCKISLL
jgi:hypothetical protein